MADYLWKVVAPDMPILPGTYSYDAISSAGDGKTDKFGRDRSVPMALSSSIGVKVGSYPLDVLEANAAAKLASEKGEIVRGLKADGRQLARHGITREEIPEKRDTASGKIKERTDEFQEKRKRSSLADTRN